MSSSVIGTLSMSYFPSIEVSYFDGTRCLQGDKPTKGVGWIFPGPLGRTESLHEMIMTVS